METFDRKKLYNKLIRFIIPLPFLLYFFNGLDRTNIGYAALTMNKELGISSVDFGIVTSVFFITYLIFQVPTNMLLERIGARKVIPTIVIGWGLATLLTFFAQNLTQLIVFRVLLGMFESGFFVGIIYWLTLWFPRSERGRVTAIFTLSLSVANIIGPPVAGYIIQYINFGGISGWRWLFIIEGILPMILGVIAWFVMRDNPDQAKWLSVEEKNVIRADLEEEKANNLANKEPVSWKKTVTNATLWKLAAIYGIINVAVQAASIWMPTLIKDIAAFLSPSLIGFVMVLPMIISVICMYWVGKHSDKIGERKWHIALPMFVLAFSFLLICLPVNSLALKMLALMLFGASVMSYYGPFWALPSELLSVEGVAISIAVINCCNAIGSICGNMLTGILMGRFGSTGVFVFFSIIAAVAGLIVLTLDLKKHSPEFSKQLSPNGLSPEQ
ncbi:MFS transporter [Desulfosporosinus lacus]|uniref:Sugar phosphate permease n=1 Tax=Desulfosporosinus lacus DSM 15449 TaxID=1121420 RepID=A0A1M5ZSA7_9FIRM|nr:MFS transporter [Desulfosporosinus lacus]SHI27187.1 Sugar phosphate permease [Desulfosporosinus lacus DSM 15449]